MSRLFPKHFLKIIWVWPFLEIFFQETNNTCMVKLKICCINSCDEAKTAISAGADLLGLVADMPSGEGMIEDHKIREIAASIKSFNNSVY